MTRAAPCLGRIWSEIRLRCLVHVGDGQCDQCDNATAQRQDQVQQQHFLSRASDEEHRMASSLKA